MALDKLSEEIEICAFCPLMCKNMCSFHKHAKTESSAPTMRNLFLWYVLQGKMDLEDVAENMYQCTLCGQCTSWCEELRDIPNNMIAAREDIVEQKIAPKRVIEVEKHTKKEHNPYGENHEKRFDNLDHELTIQRDGKTFVYVGCTGAYYQSEILGAFAKIAKAASISYEILGDNEWCCGLPQYKLGLRKSAEELAEHNVRTLNDEGCETLITLCPTCFRAFNDFYPDWGFSLNANVICVSDYLLGLIENGKIHLTKEFNETVTYHDPCDLARPITPKVRRYSNTTDIHDAPRKVLSMLPGINLVEMRWNKFRTYCCGGDVATRLNYPEISDKIGTKVPIEALKVQANCLATVCPSCKRQFSNVVENDKRFSGLNVYSICELVADAMS